MSIYHRWCFPHGSVVKNLPAIQETQVKSLGHKDPLEKGIATHSVSDSSRPHGLYPTRLLCPWNFPGKSTGVGCHFLLPLWGDPELKLHWPFTLYKSLLLLVGHRNILDLLELVSVHSQCPITLKRHGLLIDWLIDWLIFILPNLRSFWRSWGKKLTV